ncbi:MAG: 4'-phosphopantetheinyl transferase superfamily protein [Hydrogenophaga sp.]|uniref:4'-phosphopantetheinyl transferase family protein n=1 Tax=Hydrogenophaga sp. TaxID=1904254 RepID=UPI00262EFF80|nr:4'-phosphopantetheinyl transferase superfamily protein [Hydrogenophaga sp.]MCV0440851.1 4'-phosphopantetheinyl transferase superfamily protein [Hydrogenophaga sp.]
MMAAIACAEPYLSLHTTLRQSLADRLGPGIGIACTGVEGDPRRLYPEEFAAVSRAVPRRQREFAAGREAARQAMAQIGWAPVAIPSAPDRSPVWPKGLAGSITHSAGACVAVVCPQSLWQAVGIDLEEDQPMEPALWDTICTPEEAAFVNTQPAVLRGRWVTWLFSAKEAFYKWQYPQTRHTLEFQDVRVLLPHMGFPTNFRIVQARTGTTPGIRGECLARNGHLLTWVIGNV